MATHRWEIPENNPLKDDSLKNNSSSTKNSPVNIFPQKLSQKVCSRSDFELNEKITGELSSAAGSMFKLQLAGKEVQKADGIATTIK